jgi:hypothetical protein
MGRIATFTVIAAAALIGASATYAKIGSRTEVSRDVVNACDAGSAGSCLAKVDEILRECPRDDLSADGTECVCTAEQQRAALGLADAVAIVGATNPGLAERMSMRVVEGAGECFQAIIAEVPNALPGCPGGSCGGPHDGSPQ